MTTYTPILERELQAETTKRARHAIAEELSVYRREMQLWRQQPALDWFVREALDLSTTKAASLVQLAEMHFPRIHPAPGRLDWCLVNQHGPVCDSHAIPGSSYCHQHRAYEDAVRERIKWS